MFNNEELNRFYRYCVALTGNEQDAFDLLQDCLEQFIRRGAGGIENRQGYFFTMIRNRFIDNVRRGEKHPATAPGGGAQVIEVGFPSLEKIVMDREEAETILAAELARHHNQRMNMDIESASLAEIRSYLERLDFPLIESSRYPDGEWEPAGGRYCSLKGRPAAQLRLRNRNTGRTLTFYQLLVPRGMAGFKGAYEGFEQSVKVEIWTERGLLLAVARED